MRNKRKTYWRDCHIIFTFEKFEFRFGERRYYTGMEAFVEVVGWLRVMRGVLICEGVNSCEVQVEEYRNIEESAKTMT